MVRSQQSVCVKVACFIVRRECHLPAFQPETPPCTLNHSGACTSVRQVTHFAERVQLVYARIMRAVQATRLRF